MMCVVQERDLATIGAEVEMPDAATYGSRRARRELRAGQSPVVDRLTELADWWAGVAGNPRPRRADQLWLSRPPVGAQVNAELVIRPFDAPKSIAEAIEWGVATADHAVDEATDVLLVSLAPDDRDEVAWQVLAAHLLDIDPLEATGWPTADRTTDQEWVERVAAIRDGLRRVRGIRNQPERLLEVLDSPALAAGTGLLLQAASRRTPALLDGPGAAACALLAHRVGRASRSWWQACDGGHRGLHDRVLTDLRLTPLTRFALPVEDGTAARLGLTLLETALGRAIEKADHEASELDDLEGLDERPDETESTAPDA
jgi:hypothetical protein